MPICYKCREEKPGTEFYRGKNMEHRGGCHSYCKSCQKKLVVDSGRERRRSRRAEVMAGYGNKCSVCGFDDPRALALDHVNGDGAQERREWRGKMSLFYKRIIDDNFPDKYQVLCANCNAIKEFERQDSDTGE